MLSKTKTWLATGQGRPKNVHSLEHLRYLYQVLTRNSVVTEQNRELLVETVRSMSEILIWGDQNDSTVFDFFLEKNMLLFFLKILRQKTGRYICVQLLQTLNILFENIRNETSLYYLLSNNHVNAIIVHRFDFSDEEVLAYYISFLKTLSFKLNVHTIHFFYNEHTNDFALYTEAIKFFNHPESMVRIAVRTLTLNVYKVNDNAMLMYIRNKTAVPYFSNLVWFIGNHVLELDSCVRNDIDHQSRNRLSSLVAEHLDHLHYLNDILNLKIEALNDVLTNHLLNRLLIPLYIDSLTKGRSYGVAEDPPHIGSVVSLFLLSQVFLIVDHPPLTTSLAGILFHGNEEIIAQQPTDISGIEQVHYRGFVKPQESLERSLESNRDRGSTLLPRKRPNYRDVDSPTDNVEEFFAGEDEEGKEQRNPQQEDEEEEGDRDPSEKIKLESETQALNKLSGVQQVSKSIDVPMCSLTRHNRTDEEKTSAAVNQSRQTELQTPKRPYFQAIMNALETVTSDYRALISLCLLYALGTSEGINPDHLLSVHLTSRSKDKTAYNRTLINSLIAIIGHSCQPNSRIRPVTLEMASLLLKQLIYSADAKRCYLEDNHLASIEGAKEESMLLLRNFYRGDELFLDMFDDEYQSMTTRPLNVEFLMMDESIILPPTGTPLTGIDFIKRLPSGELERTRRAIRVFFLLRDLSLTLRSETETKVPLGSQDKTVQASAKLDLNNSDLIACTVLMKDKSPQRVRRFLVIDNRQLILVEPDNKKLGWGVARFVGPLQDLEVTGDKDDSRSLHVTIHKRATTSPHAKPIPLLAAKFQFDDHIRCMAAKQRLTKGRQRVRQVKMAHIAELLEIPAVSSPMTTPGGPSYPGLGTTHPGSARPVSQPNNKGFGSGEVSATVRAITPIASGIRSGLFSSPDRRLSDPQLKGTSRPPQQQQQQELKGTPGTSATTTAKTKPKPILGSTGHRSPSKSRWGIHRRKMVDGSPEVDVAQDAMSPSAYGSSFDKFAEPPIELQCLKSGSGRHDDDGDIDDDDRTDALPPTKSNVQSLTLLPSSESSESSSDSPKILPPASEERVRSLSSESVESMPPFTSKSPAAVSVNPLSASANRGKSTSVGSAQESLSRLTQGWNEEEVIDPDNLEMKPAEKQLIGSEWPTSEKNTLPPQNKSSLVDDDNQDQLWRSVYEDDSLPSQRGESVQRGAQPSTIPSLDESLLSMGQGGGGTPVESSTQSDDSSPLPLGEIV